MIAVVDTSNMLQFAMNGLIHVANGIKLLHVFRIF